MHSKIAMFSVQGWLADVAPTAKGSFTSCQRKDLHNAFVIWGMKETNKISSTYLVMYCV